MEHINKYDLERLEDWEGPSIKEMCEDLFDCYHVVIEYNIDTYDKYCSDEVEKRIDWNKVGQKLAKRNLTLQLAFAVMHVKLVSEYDTKYLIFGDKDPDTIKDIEKSFVDHIEETLIEWAQNPEKIYNILYEQYNSYWPGF